MCGRFALYARAEQLAQKFQVPLPFAIAPRYNIAPSQPLLVLRTNPDSGQPEWSHCRWGLVPRWADDPAIGNRMINARAESVAEKPAFRSAFRYRRCIVPANGFYEWQKRDRAKIPYFVRAKDDEPFGLAGLWEHWQGADGTELETCTIITTEANALIRPLHDRMAVILPEEAYSTWLDPTTRPKELQALLRPAPDDWLIAYPVSPRVNSPANDDPSLIEPVEPAPSESLFE